MFTALVIGVIVSMTEILMIKMFGLILNIIDVRSKVKEKFNNLVEKNYFMLGFALIITNIILETIFVEFVLYSGPESWVKYEWECTKIYYVGDLAEIDDKTIVIFENDEEEEKQYVISVFQEKIRVTEKAPLNEFFELCNIEGDSGRVEYHITAVS